MRLYLDRRAHNVDGRVRTFSALATRLKGHSEVVSPDAKSHQVALLVAVLV